VILYVGNILSGHGYTPTFIELLAPKLSDKYELKTASSKKNQISRMIDMMGMLFKFRKQINLLLIDSYSRRAFWYTYILALLSKIYGIKYVPILRGGGYPERLKKSPSKCNFIFSNSFKNISPSLYLKKSFEDENFDVEYIPNFLPIGEYKFKERVSVSPKLLWVRSFHKIYNPVLAIEVLNELKKKFPDAILCMVGPDKDGCLKDVIERTSELKLNDSVVLKGKLSKEEWRRLSEEYDIFINTTDFDNHPVSVIEAMALGLPVVSTDVGGMSFLIDDASNGLLVPRNETLQFAGAITRLCNDPDLTKEISLNARKLAESFDWEIVKLKWSELIESA